MEFPRCASGSGAADNRVHQLSLVIRNICNVFETLISEVHQHDTASESSGRRKIFSTDAVANCRRLRISTVSPPSRRIRDELKSKNKRSLKETSVPHMSLFRTAVARLQRIRSGHDYQISLEWFGALARPRGRSAPSREGDERF